MTISQILILTIVTVPLLGVIIGRLRMDIAALTITALLALFQFAGFGIFGPSNRPDLAILSLSGFGEDAVIILISVFILTTALEKSGFARWISSQILKVGGNSLRRLIFLFSGTAALLSLFMNDVAAAALLIPSVLEVCRRTSINPGKLLIPVSYGSLLGGMATYFATANILDSSLLQSASPPQEPLTVLAFFPTGGLAALTGILFMTFLNHTFCRLVNRPLSTKVINLPGTSLKRLTGCRNAPGKRLLSKILPYAGAACAILAWARITGSPSPPCRMGFNYPRLPDT